jgi:hypothetical protein
VGLQMVLLATVNVYGIPMWQGREGYTCAALSEAKNLVVYPMIGINPDVKVAVHVEPHASRSCTKSFPVVTNCGDITTTEPGPDVDAFPVFYDLVEYQGFDYGMAWPGFYSCVFTSCSDLSIGTILLPGDGISHAWTACMTGPVAMPGWGWIWDYGMICVVAHPDAGGPNVGDCDGEMNTPKCNFCAGIGGYFGDDPCQPTRTKPTSWGAIKAIFK